MIDYTGTFEKVAFMGFRGFTGFRGASLADDAVRTIKKIDNSPSSINYDEPVVRHTPVKRRPYRSAMDTFERQIDANIGLAINKNISNEHKRHRLNQHMQALVNRLKRIEATGEARPSLTEARTRITKAGERAITRRGFDLTTGPGKAYHKDLLDGIDEAYRGV